MSEELVKDTKSVLELEDDAPIMSNDGGGKMAPTVPGAGVEDSEVLRLLAAKKIEATLLLEPKTESAGVIQNLDFLATMTFASEKTCCENGDCEIACSANIAEKGCRCQ